MSKTPWPAFAGLFLSVWAVLGVVSDGSASEGTVADLASFSRDEALVHSQGVIGNLVTGIHLQAEDGSTVALEDFRGKPLVISLIFTSCHHICPTTTQHLAQVVDKARSALGAASFNVLTVGFDTVNDTPERMAQFQRSNAVSDERWHFLAGSEREIEKLVSQLGFLYTPSSRGFDHLIQSSLLDANGKIYRQVYGITFPTPHLIEPLKELVFGEPRKQSALDYLTNRIRLFCTVYDPATDSYQVDVSVFIGTFVGLVVSLLFGRVLYKEWRRSLQASQ